MPLNRRTPPPQAETPMRDSGHHAFSLGRIAAITDRKSTRLNSSHEWTSYAVFCLKKKKIAGELGLIGKRDGVAIRRTEKGRQRNAPRTGMIEQPAQKELCALRAFCLQYRIERL